MPNLTVTSIEDVKNLPVGTVLTTVEGWTATKEETRLNQCWRVKSLWREGYYPPSRLIEHGPLRIVSLPQAPTPPASETSTEPDDREALARVAREDGFKYPKPMRERAVSGPLGVSEPAPESDDHKSLAEHVAAHACAERHNGLRVGTAMDRLRAAFKDGAAWQRWRHPEPVKPSREDVARILNPVAWKAYDSMVATYPDEPTNPLIVEDSLVKADAVLALFKKEN